MYIYREGGRKPVAILKFKNPFPSSSNTVRRSLLSLSHTAHSDFSCNKEDIMWARICGFLILFVVLLNLVGVSSRNINQGSIQNQSLTPFDQVKGMVEKEGKYVNKIGSKPPSCEHKCYGCNPCEAIQVPTTTTHFGVLYTNYEPEGWKCKCGPTFYTP